MGDFRYVLKSEYEISLKSMQKFWVVVESSVGVYIGVLESINPDHGDVVLHSVERVDVKLNADKVWIRGSQVKQMLVVGRGKEKATAVALKVLRGALEGMGREEL